MAKKKKNKKRAEVKEKFSLEMEEETKIGIVAILYFLVAIFLSLSAFNSAGVVGRTVFSLFNKLTDDGFFIIPLVLTITGIALLGAYRPKMIIATTFGGVLFLLSSLGIIDTMFRGDTLGEVTGGVIGFTVSFPLMKLFGDILTIILLTATSIIAVMISFNTKITLGPTIFGKRVWGENEWDGDLQETKTGLEDEKETKQTKIEDGNVDLEATADETKKKENKPSKPKLETLGTKFGNLVTTLYKGTESQYALPPLSLLSKETDKPSVGDIKANANIIKRTLLNFGIDVEMDEISIGPSITRYAFRPSEGVRLAKILSLQNDLALALAAHPIRIEAPIPGKSLVGIEIPNTVKATVRLGTLLVSKKFSESEKPLMVSLGKGTSGIPHFTDLAKAPHLLIAGSTGSGKSVTIHSVIVSLLYRNSPKDLRLVMIDPKRVELTLYNGIPHLLTPVITDPKKAILVLKWLTKEMERRYNVLEKLSVRDIQSYHQNIFDPFVPEKSAITEGGETNNEETAPEKMPYIVVIIDELADIMTMYPKELESTIVRIAQMSRAVGIHLILSTQRPSVEIITGLIKANIPSRIALQVPSQIDSRTIIDMQGAEKLLGAGDMLYLSSEMSKPHRIQSAFISEDEVKKVAEFLKKNSDENLEAETVDLSEIKEKDVIFMQDLEDTLDSADASAGDNTDGDDFLYEEARELVVKSGKASTSYLQRKLKLGYARAARIMDILEERGVIGPADGAKSREVYIKREESFDEEDQDKGLVLDDTDEEESKEKR